MRKVSLARRRLEIMRKDFEAFDSMLAAGGVPLTRKPPAPTARHGRGAWSLASFAALTTTAMLATFVLLTGSAV